MTQAERLLNHFKTSRTIDPLQALREYGIFRLAARIKELKKAGHTINTVRQIVRNQFGEDCRVACYEIERTV
jgi:hypothetical protein